MRAAPISTKDSARYLWDFTDGMKYRESSYSIMSECLNCGAFVTERYVRVFAPTGMETVRVCPECPDMLREGSEVREAKSSRQ
jgi:hypothetical protein